MTDTHCHLTDERLGSQLDDVIRRAREAGVGRMVTIGTDVEDSRAAVGVCQGRTEAVRCAVGIHPTSVKATVTDEMLRDLEALQRDPAVVAIGEIGLDYYWVKDEPTRQLQQEAFRKQMELARSASRSVVIHCREAIADCLSIMKDYAGVPAVFHCFTGTTDEAGAILADGYLLGFTGVVTYKKNDWLRQIAKDSPADRILVETDAPYMTPEPMRKQKVNEPALVTHVARVVAEARGVTYDDIDRLTDENANRFYRRR